MVRVRNAVFHAHVAPQWGNRYGDVFIANPPVTLPPWIWLRALRRASRVLARHRPSASIWVRLPPPDITGKLWRQLLLEYTNHIPVPVAFAEQVPTPEAFSFPPPRVTKPLPISTISTPSIEPLTGRILEILARLEQAYTVEVASAALVSPTTARRRLRELQRDGLVRQTRNTNWPAWSPTRKGLSLALRRWLVPLGVPFPFRRERNSRSNSRHRRTARLWNAWLTRAGYSIRMGWSEVTLPGMGRFAPDALAFGSWEGEETVFWLEVESGHDAAKRIAQRTARRLAVAENWASTHKVRLVFTILGRPWAVRAAAQLHPRSAAVLLASWRDFGLLPRPESGHISRLYTILDLEERS